MKNLQILSKITFVIAICFSGVTLAQYVGINTSTPQKELDINGELEIRVLNEITSFTGNESILGVVNDEKVVKSINPNLLNAVSSTGLSVKKSGDLTVLGLGLVEGDDWQIVEFSTGGTITVGSTTNFTNSTYTVPSAGIYKIGYYFRYGTGIQAELLAEPPKIGILKTTGATSTVLDYRSFLGVNLGLANITISENSIDSIYYLQAGDLIRFAISKPSLVDLSLLGSSASSAYVYKISN